MTYRFVVLRPSDTGYGRFGWQIYSEGPSGRRCIVLDSKTLGISYAAGSDAAGAARELIKCM